MTGFRTGRDASGKITFQWRALLFSGLALLCLQCREQAVETLGPDPVSEQASKPKDSLILPGGFTSVVVADSLGPARHLAVNDNGDIYVKLRKPEQPEGLGNVALRDRDGDGRADSIVRFGRYPNDGAFATEMRIHNGYLYFSSELVVYRQKLQPGELVPQTEEERLVQDPYPIRWHNAKVLAFDESGGMYVTFSAPTNACEDGELTRQDPQGIVRGENPCSQLDILGGIWRFDAAKKDQQLADARRIATGVRSVVGMAWNPQTHALYAVNHGRDYLYNHAPMYYRAWHDAVMPAEEFFQVKAGGDYGWPYTYYDPFRKQRMLAPEYGGDGKTPATGYSDILMPLPAHWAPNDLLFYQGTQFPERYRNGAFVAFHGSMNRNPYPQGGYVVGFIPFEDGKPVGTWEVFADGFAQAEVLRTHEDAQFRPMGLAEGPDGSLYVVDSKKGRVWCIRYANPDRPFREADLAVLDRRKNTVSYLKQPEEGGELK
ncbi:PQQ-dependent sugar dehydrogenase [Robiginitalea sp. M366]|uniref:PQQ-dependent sugar dehydrogenase n=1 Tax=Robiginitalea aestuariiviva TaxID=3036903 RepID=UPI00240DABD4|nr:PQQ-dependent sugar dehydrogenase [Robiginitalea aestuariiviva]MDG1572345.1 PQQ-dependent sugar dehydrogenase [Robiginitalea aestuariiviva]